MTRILKAQMFWSVLAAVVAAVAILLAVAAQPAQSATAPAKMADDFVDSIGVNTHIRFLGSAYDTKYSLMKDKLLALGVRHIRDAAILSNDSKYNNLVYGRYRDLAASGIKFDLTLDPRRENLGTLNQAKIADIVDKAGPSLESFEGPNEMDISGISNWQTVLRNYQSNLYTLVNSNSSTKDFPVLGPSLAQASDADKVGDLSAYMDYGNMHPYPIGMNPGNTKLDNYTIPNYKYMNGNKTLMPTETGYHTTANWTGSHPAVSEKAMGKYIPRLYLEYFNRGMPRTYSYEFMDDNYDPKGLDKEDHFGLIRYDGTEKPAFKALKNLISLLEDPGPDFQTKSLDYSLSGDLDNIHHMLLQKRDGRFYLVLWQEVLSYNLSTKQDIAVAPRKVTLTLNQPISNAATYLPNDSVTPSKQYSSPRSLTLYVPDEPLVIELSPSNSGTFASTNAQPKITGVKPANDSRVTDRTPTIKATVTDDKVLRKSNIRLFLNGEEKKRFTYERSKDAMTFTKRRPAEVGSYLRIKVLVRDVGDETTTRKWKFKVVRSG